MYYVVYGILYLVSLLPYRVLYIISDIFYVLLYYVSGYRKNVVMDNLRIAFPEKSSEERIAIAKKFYKNLLDYFLEAVKLLSVSDKSFYKRCSGDFSELNRLAETGTNIQLHSGHQFNWEMANRIYSQQLIIPFVLVYMPLSGKIGDRIFKKIRLRDKTILIDATRYSREIIKVNKQQHALALVADQNPGNVKAAFWMNFFSKPAPFIHVPEKNAQRTNVPVGFASFKKIKRGHYRFETKIVTMEPASLPKGELTRMYRDFLEQQIREQPDNYLWSHRRWKYEFKKDFLEMWIG